MVTLGSIVQTRKELVSQQRAIRVCRLKTELSISAASAQSERFFHVKVPVKRLPLFTVKAATETGHIVIDVNAKRSRASRSGYVPKVVVLHGLKTLQAAKDQGRLFCNVWVGERAMKKLSIMADDAIGCNELQTKLQRLLSDKYRNKKKDNGDYVSSPWIQEVYPFENYVIFRYDGDDYRQSFKLDPVMHEASLDGEAVKVYTTYSTVPAAVKKASTDVKAMSLADMVYEDSEMLRNTMMQEYMYDVPNSDSPALGGFSSNTPIAPDGTYYPPGSELANPGIKTMLNVREALSIYLAALKNGSHKPLRSGFSPVPPSMLNASREAEIAARDAKTKINVRDFIEWQHKTLSQPSQTKFGMSASAYVWVGDRHDISTWHLPVNTKENMRKSLRRVMLCSGIPKSQRKEVSKKIEKLLKDRS